MAYSCGYFDDDDLAKAQRAKLGMVCRKLNLRPGMRLLDVGCGWGSLSIHAAAEYGVHVTGITLSEEHAGAAPGGGPFIETYIAPDMHMRPVEETVGLLKDAGLEIEGLHGLREDYVRTAAAWSRNLEARWDDAVRLLGEEGARVWRLYLAGGTLAFEQGRMGVDQILGIRRPMEEPA
jgi:cyclopropane fatty-acyl-phospholipid synthase-like methyltransferase